MNNSKTFEFQYTRDKHLLDWDQKPQVNHLVFRTNWFMISIEGMSEIIVWKNKIDRMKIRNYLTYFYVYLSIFVHNFTYDNAQQTFIIWCQATFFLVAFTFSCPDLSASACWCNNASIVLFRSNKCCTSSKCSNFSLLKLPLEWLPFIALALWCTMLPLTTSAASHTSAECEQLKWRLTFTASVAFTAAMTGAPCIAEISANFASILVLALAGSSDDAFFATKNSSPVANFNASLWWCSSSGSALTADIAVVALIACEAADSAIAAFWVVTDAEVVAFSAADAAVELAIFSVFFSTSSWAKLASDEALTRWRWETLAAFAEISSARELAFLIARVPLMLLLLMAGCSLIFPGEGFVGGIWGRLVGLMNQRRIVKENCSVVGGRRVGRRSD